MVSGEFHVESEDINKSIPIYDDLFVYCGLDEEDLKKLFLGCRIYKADTKRNSFLGKVFPLTTL